MTVLLPLYFSSFMVALSGVLMPGPIFTTTISESIRRGPTAGPRIISGHAILEGILVVALVLGLAPLLRKDLFFIGISFAGAAILVWMGLGMFRGLNGLKLDWETGTRKGGNLMAAGVLLSISNPYWVIWWATIGLSFMAHAQEAGLLGVLAFYLGHITADIVWFSLVSAAVGKGRHFISDRTYRIIIAVSALVLFGFALFFAVSGMKRLIGIL